MSYTLITDNCFAEISAKVKWEWSNKVDGERFDGTPQQHTEGSQLPCGLMNKMEVVLWFSNILQYQIAGGIVSQTRIVS